MWCGLCCQRWIATGSSQVDTKRSRGLAASQYTVTPYGEWFLTMLAEPE